MVKIIFVIFPTVLFLTGCGQLAGAIIAPTIGSIGGEMNARSNEASIQEEMLEAWDEEHNQTRKDKKISRLCHVYDKGLTIPIHFTEGTSALYYDEMKGYDKHILKWDEYVFYDLFEIEPLERKEFLLRNDCTLYFYPHIQNVSMTVYEEEYEVNIYEKRKRRYGMLEPTITLTFFDRDRNIIAEETVTGDELKIKRLRGGARYVILEEFGKWYMKTVYDFIKKNKILVEQNTYN